MGPFRSIFRCLIRFCDPRGRASRAEYTWFIVFIAAVYGLGILAIDFMDEQSRQAWEAAEQWTVDERFALTLKEAQSNWPRPGVFLVCFALTFTPGYAVAVRRGHDIGINGVSAILTFMSVFGIFSLMWTRGAPFDNQYGPPPP